MRYYKSGLHLPARLRPEFEVLMGQRLQEIGQAMDDFRVCFRTPEAVIGGEVLRDGGEETFRVGELNLYFY